VLPATLPHLVIWQWRPSDSCTDLCHKLKCYWLKEVLTEWLDRILSCTEQRGRSSSSMKCCSMCSNYLHIQYQSQSDNTGKPA